MLKLQVLGNVLNAPTYRSKARLEARRVRTPSAVSDDNDEKLERDVEVVVPVLPQSSGGIFTRRNIPPFVPSQDIVRGIVFVGQAALGYAFMLAVM